MHPTSVGLNHIFRIAKIELRKEISIIALKDRLHTDNETRGRRVESRMKIELACDHYDAEEFAAWLRENGHDITIGSSVFNYVDGVRTSSDDSANEILYQLWKEYRI